MCADYVGEWVKLGEEVYMECLRLRACRGTPFVYCNRLNAKPGKCVFGQECVKSA